MNIPNHCIQNISIKSALKAMDVSARKTLFVIDEKNVLKGALTDGDVRRWILKNGQLDESVYKIMNTSPVFLYEKDKDSAFNLMKSKQVDAVPILNGSGRIIDVLFLSDFIADKKQADKKPLNADIIINAGGKGARLNPVTLVIPKPLVPVGGVSIIERIINSFREYSVFDFIVVINYKKELVKAYFNEISRNYNISFIEEKEPLGTIGGLSLMNYSPERTVFLSNCDILIQADYNDILSFHKERKNKITIVASLKNTMLPYGVVDVDKSGRVTEIREKPQYDFLANTGFYVLEPELIQDIPKNEPYHSTDLINKTIKNGEKVGIYPIGEDCWLDMGQLEDLDAMARRLGKAQ